MYVNSSQLINTLIISFYLKYTEVFGSICIHFQLKKKKELTCPISYHGVGFRSIHSACFHSTGRSMLTRKHDFWVRQDCRFNWFNNRWCWNINRFRIYFTFYFYPQWTIPKRLFWLRVTDSWKKKKRSNKQILKTQ